MLGAVSHPAIHNDILERIKEFIRENHLQPGDRLPGEAVLSQQLGVGRPALREAFRALEAVGAIETRKGVGRFVGSFAADAYVRNFTTESLINSFSERDLAEARCLLEIASIPDAITRLTDDDLRELQDLLARMKHKIEHRQRYLEEDLGMHRILMRHTGNTLIAVMLDAIYALSSARMRDSTAFNNHVDSGKSAIDLHEHTVLVDAVLARDRKLAQQRLMDHFETTAQRQGFTPLWHTLAAD